MIDAADLRQKDYKELIEKARDIVSSGDFSLYNLRDSGIPSDIEYGCAKGSASIVLESDTAVELGSPRKESVSMALWTAHKGILENRLWISGRDFHQLMNKSVSFIQIIMLEFEDASLADESDIGRIKNLTNRIPGYMTRSMPGKSWVRINRKLMQKGFSLVTLGKLLYHEYTGSIPGITNIEIILVADNDAYINLFMPLCKASRAISGNNKKYKWLSDGVVSCDDLNCDVCEEKPSCDRLKEVIKERSETK